MNNATPFKRKTTCKASELVIDAKLTQLRPINLFVVSRYRQAYRTGAPMPPVVVEVGTNRVVSGNHRVTAFRAEYGDTFNIKVIFRAFNDEREVLEFFTKDNSSHGNPLDPISKKRLTVALLREGATIEKVAALFNVTVRRVEIWGGDTVFLTIGNKKSTLVPIKMGPQLPPDKRTMTPAQYTTHLRADRGIQPLSLICQLTRWLNNGWVATSKENLAAGEDLLEAIKRWSKVEEEERAGQEDKNVRRERAGQEDKNTNQERVELKDKNESDERAVGMDKNVHRERAELDDKNVCHERAELQDKNVLRERAELVDKNVE